MPAACSLSVRLSTRKASTTMSCVAEAVATRSAPSATTSGRARWIAERRARRSPRSAGTARAKASRAGGPTAATKTARRAHRPAAPRRISSCRACRPAQRARWCRDRLRLSRIQISSVEPDKRERQAGGEAEKHDDQHPPLQIDGERIGNGNAGGGRGRGHWLGAAETKPSPLAARGWRAGSGSDPRAG